MKGITPITRGHGTLSAGLATLALLRNRRADHSCRDCRHGNPALPEAGTPRPGVCGHLTRGRIACASWEVGP